MHGEYEDFPINSMMIACTGVGDSAGPKVQQWLPSPCTSAVAGTRRFSSGCLLMFYSTLSFLGMCSAPSFSSGWDAGPPSDRVCSGSVGEAGPGPNSKLQWRRIYSTLSFLGVPSAGSLQASRSGGRSVGSGLT